RQTIGDAWPENEFTDALRVLLIGYGYQEVMSLTIASSKEPGEAPPRVEVINPLGEDLTTLRSALLPALLNIFRLNKHRELPQRIFETADVVIEARNVRRIAAAAMHHKAAFTEAKSLVLSLLRDVGQSGEVTAVDDANFIPGRAASSSSTGGMWADSARSIRGSSKPTHSSSPWSPSSWTWPHCGRPASEERRYFRVPAMANR